MTKLARFVTQAVTEALALPEQRGEPPAISSLRMSLLSALVLVQASRQHHLLAPSLSLGPLKLWCW